MSGNGKTKNFSGNEIREMFLRFFEGKGHKRVRSSSLVPHGDPTLLFTNAGMNQFKDAFLGLEKRDYNKATTAQKCVRAGGKHNDLENVGFTKRHHTFFEMLGNFSFGDYFKKEAIAYAWELVTSPEWFGIDKSKLYATVFGGAEVSPGNTLGVDEEATKFWLEQKVPADRVFAIPGLKENFWAMGDTGPCGPCSEIHYDMGPAASDEGHADCQFPCDCGRYVEIWNLVFMQFNRDQSGKLTPLPKPCVDTGMGLERVAAVLQGVISNYDTDLFVPLMKRAAELCGVDFQREETLEEGKGGAASLRVIADHARATTFLVADGVLPSNEGRGYVLRKIMRRAMNHGRMLGTHKPFLYEMTSTVTDQMKSAYPQLVESLEMVSKTVQGEERQFARTLETGLREWDALLNEKKISRMLSELDEEKPSSTKAFTHAFGLALKRRDPALLFEAVERELGPARAERIRQQWYSKDMPPVHIDGYEAFRLWDTFGLSPDFMEEMARDQGHYLDIAGFDEALEQQRARARKAWKGGAREAANPVYAKLAETSKTGQDFYLGTSARDCRVEAIVTKNGPVAELKRGEEAEVVLDRTSFYAESGGQVSDNGQLQDSSLSQVLGLVIDAYYPIAGLIAHRIKALETIRVGDHVATVANLERRARIIRNHTGTHLVHAALRNILGTHVKQSGSLNAPDRLRFDFSHFAHVDAEELRDIEQQVNDEIRLNTQIETNVTSLEDALNSGALAFFGDKYPESNVRVVTIPDRRAARGFYSKELCGGTHVTRVGDIGVLKIVSEESVAAGVRRVEAVTGIGALEHYQQQAQTLRQLASQLNVGEDAVLAQVEKLSQTVKQLEKELEAQKRKGAISQFDDLDSLIRASREQVAKEALIKGNSQVRLVKNIKLAVSQVENVDRKALREAVDRLRQEIRSGVVVLASVENGDIALIAGVTKDLTAKVHAGKLIGALAEKLGGKGGGRPDLAEAGGKDTAGLKTALQTVPSYIEGLL